VTGFNQRFTDETILARGFRNRITKAFENKILADTVADILKGR